MPARPDPEEEPDPVVPDTTPPGREREELAGPGPAGGQLVDPDGSLPPDPPLLPDSDEPGSKEPGGTPSGLRDPVRAVRGVGAAALVIEAIVLLLAIVPLLKLGVRHSAATVTAILTLVALCLLLTGALRYRWAWWAGTAVQVLLFACGLLHVALGVLGLVFGAVWTYVLSVRRSVLG
jgi:hypothetical protein